MALFQAQQATDYVGGAASAGKDLASMGSPTMTWALAKRARDEKRSDIKIKREEDDRKFIMSSMQSAIGAMGRKRERSEDKAERDKAFDFKKSQWEEGEPGRITALKADLNEDYNLQERSRRKEWESFKKDERTTYNAQMSSYMGSGDIEKFEATSFDAWSRKPGNEGRLKPVDRAEATRIYQGGGAVTSALARGNNNTIATTDEPSASDEAEALEKALAPSEEDTQIAWEATLKSERGEKGGPAEQAKAAEVAAGVKTKLDAERNKARESVEELKTRMTGAQKPNETVEEFHKRVPKYQRMGEAATKKVEAKLAEQRGIAAVGETRYAAQVKSKSLGKEIADKKKELAKLAGKSVGAGTKQTRLESRELSKNVKRLEAEFAKQNAIATKEAPEEERARIEAEAGYQGGLGDQQTDQPVTPQRGERGQRQYEESQQQEIEAQGAAASQQQVDDPEIAKQQRLAEGVAAEARAEETIARQTEGFIQGTAGESPGPGMGDESGTVRTSQRRARPGPVQKSRLALTQAEKKMAAKQEERDAKRLREQQELQAGKKKGYLEEMQDAFTQQHEARKLESSRLEGPAARAKAREMGFAEEPDSPDVESGMIQAPAQPGVVERETAQKEAEAARAAKGGDWGERTVSPRTKRTAAALAEVKESTHEKRLAARSAYDTFQKQAESKGGVTSETEDRLFGDIKKLTNKETARKLEKSINLAEANAVASDSIIKDQPEIVEKYFTEAEDGTLTINPTIDEDSMFEGTDQESLSEWKNVEKELNADMAEARKKIDKKMKTLERSGSMTAAGGWKQGPAWGELNKQLDALTTKGNQWAGVKSNPTQFFLNNPDKLKHLDRKDRNKILGDMKLLLQKSKKKAKRIPTEGTEGDTQELGYRGGMGQQGRAA